MITELDLQEAIAECQGVRNPTASTCIKLAAFLTIQRELYGDPFPERKELEYSFAGPSNPVTIDYPGETEFARAVDGKDPSQVFPILDEIMEALMVYNKPLYDAALRKLQ